MPFASLQHVEYLDMELKEGWPKLRLAQVRAVRHYDFYVKTLNDTFDRGIAMKKCMRKFHLSQKRLYEHFAFARAYYDTLNKFN